MAVKDIFKFSRKTFFDPSAWLGLNQLMGYTKVIGSTLKTTFTPDQATRSETFEEAMSRLKVSDADLQSLTTRYGWYTLLFLGLSLISFIVGFYYLFAYHTISGWFLAIAVSLLFGANAFRYNFWYFQIKHRKLGCTVAEWWSGKLEDPKDPSA